MYIRESDAAFSVRRETMVSREIYELERAALWDRVWLYVGHESELRQPNDFRTRDVGGRPIIFCRDAGGQVRVFFNVCSHRGAEVCRQRSGNARKFTCVYHAWTYNNDGRLAAIPDVASFPPAFPKERLGLTVPARVESYRGFVFLSYDAAIGALDTWLAGARHYLDLVADQSEAPLEILQGTHEYAMKANWKLLVENSADGYHGMPVHSTYFDHIRRLGDDISAASRYASSRGLDLGNGHAVNVRRTPLARAVARWSPSLGEDLKPVLEARHDRLIQRLGADYGSEVAHSDYNLVIFPNLVVLNAMGVVVRTFQPVEVDRLKVSAWMLAPGDQTDAERGAMLDQCLMFFGPGGMATPDDVDILESVQRGLRAYREAPWSDISKGLTKEAPESRDEQQMRAFWRRYEAMMVAAQGAHAHAG